MNPWLWFLSLPTQWKTVVVSAIVSFAVFWLTHLRNSRPILIFIRRPDWNWRLKNIGRGPAFRVLFSQVANGEQIKTKMYPIAESEEVPLGDLKHGNTLIAHYTDWFGLRSYKTYCNDCENRARWQPWWPSLKGAQDETRLNRPTTPFVLAQRAEQSPPTNPT
jgi:hypothetical protein